MASKPNVLMIHSILLFVLTAFTVSQALKLSELTGSFETVPTTSNIEGMIAQQDALRADLDSLEARNYVTTQQYESDKLVFQQNIDTLLPSFPTLDQRQLREDLSELAREVDQAKRALAVLQAVPAARPAQTSQSPSRQRKPTSSVPMAPPFTVIGFEQRGGESFLAVSPLQSNRLADISLLSKGDTQNGWQLSAMEAGRAHFVLPNGKRHVLNIR